MIFFHSVGFGRGNAEVIETEMAQNPSLCPAGAAGGGEAPDRAALASRRSPASRLIGTFAALCQFSKEWSDIMRRMAPFQHDGAPNFGESLSRFRYFFRYLGLRRCG
jgi:hypothetical protein